MSGITINTVKMEIKGGIFSDAAIHAVSRDISKPK